MPKLSRFVHVFDGGNTRKHFALYHSVKLSPIFLERGTLGIINKLQGGLELHNLSSEEVSFVKQLTELGFVVGSDSAENDLEEVVEGFRPRLSTMYLVVTDRCNLGCKYCFIEAGFPQDYVCNDMTWEIAKAGIDIFREQRDRSIEDCQVWFYGGEPLLISDLLFQCLDYIAEKDPEVTPVMVCNGTLISADMAKRLSGYPQFQLTVSLDGPADMHDQMRIFKSGYKSHASVMRGVNNLKNSGVEFAVSCTLGEHNVDHVVEVSEWIARETGSSSIGMNLLVDTPKEFVKEEYIRKANNGLIDFFKIARDKEIFENRILRKVNAFVSGEPRWHDCAACGSQIVISPIGEIGICHEGLGERNTFIGSVFKPFDFQNDPRIREWCKRSPASMVDCHACDALGICGGGCPYGSMLKHGSMWSIDERFCIHSKETLEWLIWDLYEKVTTSTV